MLLNYILIGLIVLIGATLIHVYSKFKKLEKRALRVDADINTLHQNEGVLLSSMNELAKKVRHYEDFNKRVKRHIRTSQAKEAEEAPSRETKGAGIVRPR